MIAKKMKCAQRPVQGSFTVGGVHDFKMRSEGTGGYTVKDDKGIERVFPNSVCFVSVSKSGKTSKPPKVIPRGMSHIVVEPKRKKEDDEQL